jgi:hypothetical protein
MVNKVDVEGIQASRRRFLQYLSDHWEICEKTVSVNVDGKIASSHEEDQVGYDG